MESFWATLKTELVFHRKHEALQEAIREIAEYKEVFYNLKGERKDSATDHWLPSNIILLNP